MSQIEKLLTNSISHYRELLSAYGAVEVAVSSGGGADLLDAVMARMAETARLAKEADTAFQEKAAKMGTHLLEIPLFDHWISLLSEVIDENRRVNKFVHAAMAMTKDDLTRMKKSKTAVTGYHSGHGRTITTTGKRINCGV